MRKSPIKHRVRSHKRETENGETIVHQHLRGSDSNPVKMANPAQTFDKKRYEQWRLEEHKKDELKHYSKELSSTEWKEVNPEVVWSGSKGKAWAKRREDFNETGLHNIVMVVEDKMITGSGTWEVQTNDGSNMLHTIQPKFHSYDDAKKVADAIMAMRWWRYTN